MFNIFPQEVYEMFNPWPGVIILIIILLILALLFIQDFLNNNYLKRTDNRISRFHEVSATLNMNLDETIDYFKRNYNFEIGQDSYLLINKAEHILKRTKELNNDLNNVLLAAQSGVVTDKDFTIDKINQAGNSINTFDNELELMIKLFNHLKEYDITYSDEVDKLISIKKQYNVLQKSILHISMSLIAEVFDE